MTRDIKALREKAKKKVAQVFSHLGADYYPGWHSTRVVMPSDGMGTITKQLCVSYGKKKRKAGDELQTFINEIISELDKAIDIDWTEEIHPIDSYIINDQIVNVWPNDIEFTLEVVFPITGEVEW